jgi:hypothetical protein
MQLKIASTKASLGANQPSVAGLSKAIKSSSKSKADNPNDNQSIDKNSETKNQAEKQGSTTLADNVSGLIKNISRFDQVKDKVLPTDPATLANQFGYSLPGAAKNPEQNSSATTPSQSNSIGQQQGSGNASPAQGSGVVNNYYGSNAGASGHACRPPSNNHSPKPDICPSPRPGHHNGHNNASNGSSANNNLANNNSSANNNKPDLIAHNEAPKEPPKPKKEIESVNDQNQKSQLA